jgi:hypothetical protein
MGLSMTGVVFSKCRNRRPSRKFRLLTRFRSSSVTPTTYAACQAFRRRCGDQKPEFRVSEGLGRDVGSRNYLSIALREPVLEPFLPCDGLGCRDLAWSVATDVLSLCCKCWKLRSRLGTYRRIRLLGRFGARRTLGRAEIWPTKICALSHASHTSRVAGCSCA